MSTTPYLHELKAMCGSEKLHECFKFLMCQEIPMNEAMIMWLGERRDDLRISVEKCTERMRELLELNFDEEESTDDTYESLQEIQVMERRLLEDTIALFHPCWLSFVLL